VPTHTELLVPASLGHRPQKTRLNVPQFKSIFDKSGQTRGTSQTLSVMSLLPIMRPPRTHSASLQSQTRTPAAHNHGPSPKFECRHANSKNARNFGPPAFSFPKSVISNLKDNRFLRLFHYKTLPEFSHLDSCASNLCYELGRPHFISLIALNNWI